MGLIMQTGKYVGRSDIAEIPTPECTSTWHPVSHSDLIEAVTSVATPQDLRASKREVRTTNDRKASGYSHGNALIVAVANSDATRPVGRTALVDSHDTKHSQPIVSKTELLVHDLPVMGFHRTRDSLDQIRVGNRMPC